MNLAEKLDINHVDRTYDTALVRSILSNNELIERSGSNDLSIYDPENQPDIIYLLPKSGETVIGVIIIHAFNNQICCQIHVNYLPKYWGMGLTEYSNLAVSWIFSNTDFTKVIAFAPDAYPEVFKHCEKCGLKKEGYLINSVMSKGKLDNQSIMSIEKCHQQP